MGLGRNSGWNEVMNCTYGLNEVERRIVMKRYGRETIVYEFTIQNVHWSR